MRALLLLAFVITPYLLLAQTFSVRGQVRDIDHGPVIGANASIYKMGTAEIFGDVTAADGSFLISNLESGRYRLVVSYVGYKSYVKRLRIEDRHINLGEISLELDLINLEEVEIKEKAPQAVIKGDTTQYNASAFKTLPDADAKDLVSKMPGVVIEDGKVQAQGEDVQKVLVDGREFFGNDPNATLNNLPSEVIDKIQIFDQQSDQSQFTGFDDGETNKTINIVTKPNMRVGQFGKLYGGYGTEERYRSGGNISIFNKDQRISIIGHSNNINEQNFSTEDLLGVVGGGSRRRGGFRPSGGGGRSGSGRSDRGRRGGGSISDFLVGNQPGIAQTHAMGINYSDKWGEKFELSGSYFFNMSDNVSQEEIIQEYFDTEEFSEIYGENSEVTTDNLNHRVQMKLEYEMDDKNSILMRPRISFQSNQNLSLTDGFTHIGDALSNSTDNQYGSDISGFNFSNSLLFRHKFNKERRTLSLSINQGINNRDGSTDLLSLNQFFMPVSADTLDQETDILQEGWSLGTNLSYTEPLSERGMMMFSYRLNYDKDDSDKSTYDIDPESDPSSILNSGLSSVYENSNTRHNFQGSYQWRKDAWMVLTRLSYQYSVQDGVQSFPTATGIRKTYKNILPFFMLRYSISKQRNLRIYYRSSTQNPSITSLQNVIDNSNPIQLSTGNPNLDQSVQHSIHTRYSSSNTDKGTVFYAMLGASMTNDYISENTYLNGIGVPIYSELGIDPGLQLSIPENVDGYWSLRSFFTYGFPVSGIRSKLNINLSGNYSSIPGFVNSQKSTSTNGSAGLGLVLTSNISEKIDFSISSRSTFGNATNDLVEEQNSKYINQVSGLKLDAILPGNIIFRTQFSHYLYNGYAEGFDENFSLWNLSIGKKFLKNNRGEISLSVFDLLNQNQSIHRNVTNLYIEDTRANVLERYFMLQFKFDLRHFNVGR